MAANWLRISSSITEIYAQVLAPSRADIAAAEQALTTADELALRRNTALAESQTTSASSE